MERDAVVSAVQEAFERTFKKVPFSETLKKDEVKKWDSMNHVKLMMALEKKFKIRFSGVEVAALHSVGEIVKILEEKLSS